MFGTNTRSVEWWFSYRNQREMITSHGRILMAGRILPARGDNIGQKRTSFGKNKCPPRWLRIEILTTPPPPNGSEIDLFGRTTSDRTRCVIIFVWTAMLLHADSGGVKNITWRPIASETGRWRVFIRKPRERVFFGTTTDEKTAPERHIKHVFVE